MNLFLALIRLQGFTVSGRLMDHTGKLWTDSTWMSISGGPLGDGIKTRSEAGSGSRTFPLDITASPCVVRPSRAITWTIEMRFDRRYVATLPRQGRYLIRIRSCISART